jgi:hypothetical protein
MTNRRGARGAHAWPRSVRPALFRQFRHVVIALWRAVRMARSCSCVLPSWSLTVYRTILAQRVTDPPAPHTRRMEGSGLALLQAASGLRAPAKNHPRGLKNSRPGVSVKGLHSVVVVEEEQVPALLVVVVRFEEAVEEEMVKYEVVVEASGVEEEQEEQKGGGGRVRVVEEFQTSSWEGWARDATETMREQQKMDAQEVGVVQRTHEVG